MNDCPDKKELGKRLRALRKDAGYTNRAAFAEDAGLPATIYSEVEQGRTRLSYENAWKIADVLGISLDELGGRDWPGAGSAEDDPERRELMGYFDDLNEEGREAAVQVVRGMTSVYIKRYSPELGAQSA